MLTATALSKEQGSRQLFQNVSLQLSSGRRIALVGSNGVGKTTLIEILLGIQDPDSGSVHRPSGVARATGSQGTAAAWRNAQADPAPDGHLVDCGRMA